MSKVVSIVGYGRLGQLLAEELSKLKVKVRVVSRSSPAEKGTSLHGAEFEKLDVAAATAEEVEKSLSGSFAVVCVLQGGPDVIVEGQSKLLAASAKLGIRRYISSTFSLNYLAVPKGLIFPMDLRLAFDEKAELIKDKVEVNHILNGAFLSKGVFSFIQTFDGVDTFSYYGEGNSILEATTWRDTARYTAAAAIDDRTLPKYVALAGDSVVVGEFAEHYNKGDPEKKAKSVRQGSLADLEAKLAKAFAENPQNIYAFVPLQFSVAIMRGYGRLPKLSNDLFPQIKPLNFEQAVREKEFF